MSETDVTLVMGKPVAGSDKDSVSVKLQELNLKMYEQELIDEQGYDSVETLKMLSPDELTQLADDCKMKPGHKKKFLAAFETKPATETKPAKPAEPAEPAVDPNMIALQEQVAAMKKQQSTDRLKKDLEEREKKIKEEAEARREADRKETEMRQKMADMQMEQMKMQMQANMNLNLASQNQAQAAAPIVINNNNNNNNNIVTGGGCGNISEEEKNKAEAKTPAAADAKVFVEFVGQGAPASGLLKENDLVLTINGVKATDMEQAVELHRPAVGDVVCEVLRGKEFVTVTMHKPQADMKLGVRLSDIVDPMLMKARRMLVDLCGATLEKPEWKLMTSAQLQEELKPIAETKLESMSAYLKLRDWGKVIHPAFAELADGTSKSGTPKSPIDTHQHPDYIAAKDAKDNSAMLTFKDRARGPPGSTQTPSPLLCWDHPDYLGLASNPWFKEQPQYKSLFDQASAINEGKLAKMNKAGKVEVAKQFIAAHKAAVERLTAVESPVFYGLFEAVKAINAQVKKVQLEEAQARAPAGGGGCCVVL